MLLLILYTKFINASLSFSFNILFTFAAPFYNLELVICFSNALFVFLYQLKLFSDPPPVAMEIDIKPGGDADAGSDDSPAGIVFFPFNSKKFYVNEIYALFHYDACILIFNRASVKDKNLWIVNLCSVYLY